MAALADITTTPHHFQALQDEARKRGIELLIQSVAKPDEIAPAIEAAKASDVAALNVLASPLLFANRQIIIERAANCVCRQCTNGRRWLKRAVLLGTARVSSNSIEIYWDGN
jgi:hypothetical protein